MVPDLTVVKRIEELLPKLTPDVAGITGIIRDRFPGGGVRCRHTHESSGSRASYFGGAVVLRRTAVMAAGNWNGRVVANEELDLHARIRSRGQHVRFEKLILVDHWTAKQSIARKLAFLVNWRGMAASRYGAPGFALRSCMEHGAVRHLVGLSPEPFVTTPVSVTAVVVGFTGAPWTAAGTMLLLWGWIGRRRGFPYIVPSYLLFPQIIVGFFRYDARI
jgi:hypothetical protein